jgi:hypothetical protein
LYWIKKNGDVRCSAHHLRAVSLELASQVWAWFAEAKKASSSYLTPFNLVFGLAAKIRTGLFHAGGGAIATNHHPPVP